MWLYKEIRRVTKSSSCLVVAKPHSKLGTEADVFLYLRLSVQRRCPCVTGYTCVETRRQPRGSFLRQHPPWFLRQGVPQRPGLQIRLGLLASKPRVLPPASSRQCWGQPHAAMHRFYAGSRIKLRSSLCTASTLPTELPPQPQKLVFLTKQKAFQRAELKALLVKG